MEELRELFAEIVPGESYVLSFAWASSKVHRKCVYKVLGKKQHSDYSYSVMCEIDGRVGHYWIVPSWRIDFKERIVSIERQP